MEALKVLTDEEKEKEGRGSEANSLLEGLGYKPIRRRPLRSASSGQATLRVLAPSQGLCTDAQRTTETQLAGAPCCC